MILSEILDFYSSLPSNDIQCEDNWQFKRFHRFIREAILDRHIPHYKIIGVSYLKGDKSIKRVKSFVNIEGNDSIGESYPELMLNLQDKVFLPSMEPTKSLQLYNITLSTGVNISETAKFTVAETGDAIPFLHTNEKLCTVMNDEVILQVTVYYGCKYIDMASTSKLMTKNVFPFYVDYSLQDYVRVLPPMDLDDDTCIRIRYYNGMTKDKLIRIMRDWEKAIKTLQFGVGEALWLQRLEH